VQFGPSVATPAPNTAWCAVQAGPMCGPGSTCYGAQYDKESSAPCSIVYGFLRRAQCRKDLRVALHYSLFCTIKDALLTFNLLATAVQNGPQGPLQGFPKRGIGTTLY